MTLIPPPSAESLKRAKSARRRSRRQFFIGSTVALCALTGIVGASASTLTGQRRGTVDDSALLSVGLPVDRVGDLMLEDSLEHTVAHGVPSSKPTPSPTPSPSKSASASATPTVELDQCPGGDFSGMISDGRCTPVTSTPGLAPSVKPQHTVARDKPAPAPAPQATATKYEVRLMQATSAAPQQYYCAMWWDGVGRGEVSSGGKTFSESGKQVGVGGTFHYEGPPGGTATCTFRMDGVVVGTRQVAVSTQ